VFRVRHFLFVARRDNAAWRAPWKEEQRRHGQKGACYKYLILKPFGYIVQNNNNMVDEKLVNKNMSKKTITYPYQQAWQFASMAFAVVVLALLIVFNETFFSIVVTWWRSETFSHGFVILPIVAYLIWRLRHELVRLPPSPTFWALPWLVLLVLSWVVATISNVLLIQQLSVVALVPVSLWLLFGTRIVSKLTFPLAYLIFAVPMGEFLVPILQNVTAAMSVNMLGLSGIPVFTEGLFIYIPSGSFEVAEACSGIRYLIASIALSTIYAYLMYQSFWRRSAFVVLSIIVPIIANGIRAYGIIMIAHLSDYKLAVGIDHFIYGWLFFGLVMLLMFWGGSYFREEVAEQANSDVSSAPNTAGQATWFGFLPWVVCGVFILSSGPLLAHWVDRNDRADRPFVLNLPAAVPSAVNGWSGPHETDGRWRPSYHGASQEKLASYSKNNTPVQVYVGHYSRQEQGVELVNSLNKVADGKRWVVLSESEVNPVLGEGEHWAVREFIIAAGDSHRLVWQWYEVSGQATISPLMTKFYEFRARLMGTYQGSSVIMVAMDYNYEKQDSYPLLKNYLLSMKASLRQALVEIP